MIRGLGRCLQYRNGLSERFVRNHWSTPSPSSSSSPQAASTSTGKPTEPPRDVDFAANFKNLLPSQQFRSLLSEDKSRHLDHLIKQIELYCYMARKVPSHLSDESWQELMGCRTVVERVCKMEFFAVKERRDASDRIKAKDALFSEYMKKQTELYEAGGMGYGPDLYELISNPLRRKQRVHQFQGSYTWSTLRLDTSPTMVVDMQYIFDGKHKGEFNIKRQLQYVMSENMFSRRPLPLLFSNVVNNEFGRGYMENALGNWSTSYSGQTILPDYVSAGPREAVLKSTSKKNPKIVYISRYAKKILDGPLDADAYVFCASYDTKRESIIAAHKDRIDAYRLPIQRYVKWESGAQVIPFPNMARIFREVIDSGGDWQTALYNNISKRHTEAPNEDVVAIRQSNRRNQERERSDIINAIIDSYGQ